MDAILLKILSYLGVAGFVFILVLLYYDNIRSFIKDIVSLLAATFGWFKTESTKLEIETNGTKSIKNLNRIVPELGLPDLCIEWVKTDDSGQVRLEPGKAIVLLRYNKDNTQNIINTTAAYVHKTLLINSKHFMDNGIRTAIDFSIIREFLNKTSQKNYVVSQYVDSVVDEIDKYGDAFNKVIKVEEEGLLTRVLIREYAVWGNKLIGKIHTPEYELESKQFLDFIYNIATREFDELTPLIFKEGSIKVAILLVAKFDTYAEKGIEPYVRRIREEFANGINTFYLLARNDKIAILNDVYGQIMSTGNYNLLNGPEIYKDNIGRDNICYCIEVKSDADIAISYNEIKQCINDEKGIEAIVTKVHKDEIKCEYQGLTVVIPRSEITESKELRLKNYYAEGMIVEAIPLKVVDRGEILCSLINTRSNPQKLFNNQYEVGSIVTAIVESTDNDYVNLRIKDSDQQCIAFRRNLTPSRFAKLQDLFPIGESFEFAIKDIDYIYNKLVLSYKHMYDPWLDFSGKLGDEAICIACKIKDTCIETELSEGLFAILPFSELSWLESEIDSKKKAIKQGSTIKARIKKIIREEKLIILTCRTKESPYQSYFESLDKDNEVNVRVVSNNSYGVNGLIDNSYKVFVPFSETYIGSNKPSYNVGKQYKVKIKEVDPKGTSFIGTFKPFISHPLQRFIKRFKEGQILSHLQFVRATENGAYFKIVYEKDKQVEALLLNKDVSNWCFIKGLEFVFKNDFSCPLVIKEINLERNIVLLSMKSLSELNKGRLDSINYGDEYNGVVLGKDQYFYSVLLENVWIEVKVESDKVLSIGERVVVMKASATTFVTSSGL